MDIWFILSAVGSIASLVDLLLPAQGWKQRAVDLVYGVAIFATTSAAFWYWKENSRIRSVERAATAMAAGASFDYTHAGFVHAALAFLEKNKDLYPDSYLRAQKLVDDCKCMTPHETSEVVGLSFALRGLLKGISTLEGGT
jgi:hypothetical protein